MFVFLLVCAIVATDQLTKWYIRKTMVPGEKKNLFPPKLILWRIENTGVAYNTFKEKTKTVLFLSSSLFAGLIGNYFFMERGKKQVTEKLSFSFLLGGALGNLLDRVFRKSVTDFIFFKFKYGPIFNIADIFIVVGSIMTLIHRIKSEK
ncbi:MAG: signal peptidase II [Clostridiales bacterium]|nr:signal peptidase II [Clostridiales bacterium]